MNIARKIRPRKDGKTTQAIYLRKFIAHYCCPIKLFNRLKKLGLVPFAGFSPNWLLCFYHKTSVTMGKSNHFSGQPLYSQVIKLLDKSKILHINRERGDERYKGFNGWIHRLRCKEA